MIIIDIPADLNNEDDLGRNLAPIPGGRVFKAGEPAVAGRSGFWSWVLIDEVDDDVVYFRQVTAPEARHHGSLVAAPALMPPD
jgi:hypothetical protein